MKKLCWKKKKKTAIAVVVYHVFLYLFFISANWTQLRLWWHTESTAVIFLGKQDLPHPAVPVEESRAALSPGGPNGAGGWRTDKDAGARCESRCFKEDCSIITDWYWRMELEANSLLYCMLRIDSVGLTGLDCHKTECPPILKSTHP